MPFFVRSVSLTAGGPSLLTRLKRKLVRSFRPRKPPPRKAAPARPAPPTPGRVTILDNFAVPTFPIDVVFTWVDGGDEKHASKRAQFTDQSVPADRHRFVDHEELRYALRSVTAYLPWVNHIYIVTDDQRPYWLAEHPQVSIVDHREILDQRYLPTFNSHVIESALHRIPGLSEHYIYLNDDMMFLRPMDPRDFFTSAGLAYSILSKTLLPDEEEGHPVSVTAQMRALNMVRRLHSSTFWHRLKHTYYPQRRSVLEEGERLFSTEFATMRTARVRSPDDFVTCTSLHGALANATGRGLFRRNTTHYVAIRSADAPKTYSTILSEKGGTSARDSLCVNDSTGKDQSDDLPGYAGALRAFLEAYFPCPSPFERSVAATESSVESVSRQSDEAVAKALPTVRVLR